jgi:hypothetical protein
VAYHKKSTNLVEPSIEQLNSLVRALNDKDEDTKELRRLIAKWDKLDRDLSKMLPTEKALINGKSILVATGKVGKLVLPPAGAGSGYSGKRAARALFTTLVTHSLQGRFGGPCQRPDCGRFFLSKKDSTKKIYCPGGLCGSGTTARARMKDKRRDEHEKAVKRARQAARQWSARTGQSWKEFVSEKTGFTLWWISRAAKKGELRRPDEKGGKHQKRKLLKR